MALSAGIGAPAFIGRPVASQLIPRVTPYRALRPDHPAYHRVSAQITMDWIGPRRKTDLNDGVEVRLQDFPA